MARVLILRDSAAAARIAAALERRGHQPLLLPVQEIRPLDPAVGTDHPGGLILTSSNAVPFAVERFGGAELPALAVGSATATALRQAGFAHVEVGTGRAIDLAEAAEALAREAGRPLLYLAGRVRRPDLEVALRGREVPFEITEVYDTRALHPTREEIEAAVGDRPPDAVLLLSAGQADGFCRLVETVPEMFSPMPTLLCLSERIAAALPEHRLGFAIVSPRPESDALLDAWEALRIPSLDRAGGSSLQDGS